MALKLTVTALSHAARVHKYKTTIHILIRHFAQRLLSPLLF